MTAASLSSFPVLQVEWTLDHADEGVGAWTAFAAREGVEIVVPDDVAVLIARMRKRVAKGASPRMARDIILQRLAVLTNDALAAEGRPERMRRILRGGGEADDGFPRWALLDDDTRKAIQRDTAIHFAVPPGRALLLQLATLVIAVAILAIGYRALTAERWDWAAGAIVLYAIWFMARRWLNQRLGVMSPR